MTHLVKIAELDELPPGKGKVTIVEGREVTIYNLEGRYVATGSGHRTTSGPLETTCEMPGHTFLGGTSTSPDRLRADEIRYHVETTAHGVYVVIEEGAPTVEPVVHRKRRGPPRRRRRPRT